MPSKRIFMGLGALLVCIPLGGCLVSDAPSIPESFLITVDGIEGT